jgi:hypothetical protein
MLKHIQASIIVTTKWASKDSPQHKPFDVHVPSAHAKVAQATTTSLQHS